MINIFLAEVSNWSFDWTQYAMVWKFVIQAGLLLIFMLLGNLLVKVIPFLRKAFIPSALIGGLLLFLVNLFFEVVFKFSIVDKRIMQIITYHALAIGFIAMSLKIIKKKEGISVLKVFQNGALTGGTYMLQAIVGICISLLFFYLGGKVLFYDAGVLLPLGYGQGPGNALTWDINFTNAGLFDGNGSFGLTIASVGFIVASIVGVIYINIQKRKGAIEKREFVSTRSIEIFEQEGEIEDSDSVDKSTIQIAFVFVAYAIALGIMLFFKGLTDWTGVKLFNSVAWGFNFIWGVVAATLVKFILKFLMKKKVVKKQYINNYQMDRIAGFAFDMMIIAGVSAIDIKVVSKYALPLIVICVAGAIVTVIYVNIICRKCFKGFVHESFLLNFGTLTGTASNGMILLREIDPNFKTPASDVYIVSQFPAMLFVAPLLVLLTLGSSSIKGCIITLIIFTVLFIAYTLFLLLSSKEKKTIQKEEKEV